MHNHRDDTPLFEHHSYSTPQETIRDPHTATQCYVPLVSTPVDLNYSERLGGGLLHYVPPAAVSTRYYALQDPNVYVDAHEDRSDSASFSAPSPVTPYDSHMHSPASAGGPDIGYADDGHDVYMASAYDTAAPVPLSLRQEFRIPYAPTVRAHPDLPKQRRNRDYPGDDTGQLAQHTARCEEHGTDYPYDYGACYDETMPGQQRTEQPAWQIQSVVPSQWKLGAALDKLRFPQYGGDWDTMISSVTGQPYEQTLPRANSPLSEEEMARFFEMRSSLGLGDVEQIMPPPPPPPSTPVTADVTWTVKEEYDDVKPNLIAKNKVIYSPTTARRLPMSSGGEGSTPQLTNVKKPYYKRGTAVACAFCRRRKIACGGPQEGDEAKRCGQCIQRRQPCEFPSAASRLASRAQKKSGNANQAPPAGESQC